MVADDDKPAEAEAEMSEEEKAAAAAWEEMAGGDGGGRGRRDGHDGPVSNRVLDQSEIDSLLGISGGGGGGGGGDDKPSGIQAILSSALVSATSACRCWRSCSIAWSACCPPAFATSPRTTSRSSLDNITAIRFGDYLGIRVPAARHVGRLQGRGVGQLRPDHGR